MIVVTCSIYVPLGRGVLVETCPYPGLLFSPVSFLPLATYELLLCFKCRWLVTASKQFFVNSFRAKACNAVALAVSVQLFFFVSFLSVQCRRARTLGTVVFRFPFLVA